MGKQFSTKTHMSSFTSKDYNVKKIERYWKILNSIESDSMIDSEELLVCVGNLRKILEKEIQNLMKKGISIPNL